MVISVGSGEPGLPLSAWYLALGNSLGIMGWSVAPDEGDGWGCGLFIGWFAFEEHMLQCGLY